MESKPTWDLSKSPGNHFEWTIWDHFSQAIPGAWWCQDKNGKQGYVFREILSLNPPTSV